MRKLDAIIFDFDGTLAELTIDFDLMKRKIAALGEVFLGERPEPGSTPALEWLEDLVQETSRRDRDEGMEFRTRGRLVIAAMELDAAREGTLFKFTRPALETLRSRAVGAGVITRNISAAVKIVFPDIEELTQVFIPRELARCVKPDPDHLLSALECLGADPARSLMVGDHPMDIETAKAAGSLSAAVTSGRTGGEVFRSMTPDYLAADVGELMIELERDGLV
ncbi:MAG: HAD-IA family hydrolase [Pseudodesulfovibrio sp.]|nr:HAD-IA family hydrolase [Pseudodesulfovibrio sp.]